MRRSATRRTTAGARGPRNTTDRAPPRGASARLRTAARRSSRPSRSTGCCRRSTSSSAGRAATERRVAHGLGHPAHLAGRGRADPRLHRDARRVDGRGRPADKLGFYAFGEALAAGISAHHAGMLPVLARRSRSCSRRGWSRSCSPPRPFLGINMPARSVVIEDCGSSRRTARDPHAGRVHATDRPGGRRGIDDLGTPSWCTSARCCSSASRRWPRRARMSSPPRSASYNMAVNLVRNYTREQAHHLLNSSFAQFLADRGGRPIASSSAPRRRSRLPSPDALSLGDFREYWWLRGEGDERPRGGPEGSGTDQVGLGPGGAIGASSRGRHLRPAGQTPRARGGPVGPRGGRRCSRRTGSTPPVGARLRGRARRPDEGAAVQIGRCSQRAIPP